MTIKRILIIILCAVILMLAACQATPDVEYVVNKGDNRAEEIINATALPTAAPKPTGSGGDTEPTVLDTSSPWVDWSGQAVFPERWEDHIMTEAKEVIISADVITSGTGSYPVQLVRKTTFSQDDLMRMADYLFHDVTGWRRGAEPSREYIMEAMQYVAASDMKEESKQDQLEYLRLELSAIETTDADTVSCSNLESITVGGRGVTVFTSAGGGNLARYDDNISLVLDLFGIVQPRSWFDFELDKPEFTPEISREEALGMAEEFLTAMGIEGFDLYSGEEARCINSYTCEIYDMGWDLRFSRSYGYVPFSVSKYDASQNGPFVFNSKLDRELTEFSAPLKEELLGLYVTGSGVTAVTMYNPYEYVTTVNENVQLMDFEELTNRIKLLLTAAVNNPRQVEGYFVLEKMILTAIPQQKKDSSDYYLMPVWVCVFGDYYSVDGPFMAHYYSPGEQMVNGMEVTLAFNAIDGTRVSLPQG